MGCGERLSAILISGVLRANGIPGKYINMSTAFEKPVHTGDSEYHRHVQEAIQVRHRRYSRVAHTGAVVWRFGETGCIVPCPRRICYPALTLFLEALTLRSHSPPLTPPPPPPPLALTQHDLQCAEARVTFSVCGRGAGGDGLHGPFQGRHCAECRQVRSACVSVLSMRMRECVSVARLRECVSK